MLVHIFFSLLKNYNIFLNNVYNLLLNAVKSIFLINYLIILCVSLFIRKLEKYFLTLTTATNVIF